MKALKLTAVREYLERVRHLDQLIQYKVEQIKRLDELAAVGIPESSKIAEYKDDLRLAIEELIGFRQEVESFISQIQDERLRTVLMLRYCLNLKWEDVAERMNYTLRNVANLHVKAMQCLERMVKRGDLDL